MEKMFAGLSRFLARMSLLAIVAVVVMVPVLARSREQIEHREATRLSIRHNWLGVAPPSKATVAPQQVVVPTVTGDPNTPRPVRRAPVAAAPARRRVLAQSPDPLRGPPSLRLS